MSGHDYWAIGYTHRSSTPEVADARPIIARHLEDIRALLPEIDAAGLVEISDLNEVGYREDGSDGLLDFLMEGYESHLNEEADLATYVVPGSGNTTLWFTVRSDAVGEFAVYQLLTLVNVIDQLPDLGRELGILGGGIRLKAGDR